MRLLRTTAIVITAAMIVLLVVVVPPVHGAPSADGVLNNPSFEGGFTKSTVEPDWTNVPNGWTPWYSEGGSNDCGAGKPVGYKKPHIEDEFDPHHIKDGSSSARVWIGYGIINGGLSQTVAATAGSTYQFAAWGFLWAVDAEHAMPGNKSDSVMSFQVGIDPGGGTNGSAGSVKWSGGTQEMDAFTQQSVSATATGSSITVFLRATAYWCVARNDSRFDATTLTMTGAGAAPTAAGGGAAKPTKAPSGTWGVKAGSIVTETPAPDGSITHTVGNGQTCIGIATAYGIELATLEKQNKLTNATCKFIAVGLKLIIKPAGSGGGGGSDATPEATEAATEAPTVEPTQEVAAVTTGTVCVLGYDDQNSNGIREPTEPKLAGMTFTVNGATGPVQNYTTDGVAEPHCFAQLPPGSYTVIWEGQGLSPSGDQAQNWPVTVAAGSTASHEFGASSSGGGGATTGGGGGNPPPASTGLPTWAIALIGAFGVILFMGGLGVAGYFLLLRRTNI